MMNPENTQILTTSELPQTRNRLKDTNDKARTAYAHRPEVRGKFLFVGDEKLYIRGVTYGTFSPKEDGYQFPLPEVVEKDFALMAANGINCVRTYTAPPKWLLDCAQKHGLRVMAGLAWEQHVTFLDNKKQQRAIQERIRQEVRTLNRHPAILLYAMGNEIPPPIVRWHGRERIERFLKSLYAIIKQEDPQGLVTYVNFPTTEFLQLGFLDVIAFNVYLEKKNILAAYLARLHNIADEKPLVMAEVGLDSRRNGEAQQAEILQWQIETVFASGCAGMFVFAWTDEWYRGGNDIDDWDFGLTTRERRPKPALDTVKNGFRQIPFPDTIEWPRVSVFICSYNGARTIRKTLEELKKQTYPNFEVVVVNDGSKDRTPEIAREFNARLINTENRGLSTARNEALKHEAGEIVVYLDDDAYPDPDWLKYIAYTFLTTDYVAVGGPNLLPLESGLIENCVGNAPGGPTHVLIGNTEAEHIPGCNMAYRKICLQAAGGFDPQFHVAGDDVDLCWRILKMGGNIGYHPAAFVWHHRRNTLKTYWKQQFNYGKAEAMLEEKWPDKYNAIGHIPWMGRLYGKGQTVPLVTGRWRVYQGVWGSAPFQSIYQPAANAFFSLPLMPEWYLIIAILGILTVTGLSWHPLLSLLPVFVLAVVATLIQAAESASRAVFTIPHPTWPQKITLYTVTAYLHLLQPLARLCGRLKFGLSPWKCRGVDEYFLTRKRTISLWSEEWRSAQEWLGLVEDSLRKLNVPYHLGGEFESWDFEVRGGMLGATNLQMTIEEHGQGKQMLRFRLIPNYKIQRTWIIGVFFVLAVLAARELALGATVILGGTSIFLTLRMLKKCAYSKAALISALSPLKGVHCYEAE